MASPIRRNLIWFLALNLSLCLIVNAGIIHRPNFSDEEYLPMIVSNGLLNNDYENSNRNDRNQPNIYPILLPSLSYDDNTIRQMINRHRDIKRSKLNLHTNLNLPRYLRTAD